MKPKRPQKKIPNKRQKRDFFQTPRYAVKLLLPYIPKNAITVWECAAGKRKISDYLELFRYEVFSTDLNSAPGVSKWNFLDDKMFPIEAPDCIITNPPFSLKQEFYRRCILYQKPFALLIPMDMTQWNLEAVLNDGAQWLVPNRRIDYITPNGKQGKSSQAQFHSGWLTWGFNLPSTLTVVDLPLQWKKDLI